MSAYGVVLFFTTSSALRAERVLLDAKLEVKLIPTPREFSSDCGIACRFSWPDLERVKKTLDAAEVECSGIRAFGEAGNG
jgi:hypothetical protein